MRLLDPSRTADLACSYFIHLLTSFSCEPELSGDRRSSESVLVSDPNEFQTESDKPFSDKKQGTDLQSATNTAADLPEEFVLTPEIVEEEAIRGDFVLRWAAILLAVLLGCTVISETKTLVHVKAGQNLVANNFLPDGTDPFAYTTEGRTWRNQSWLFDLALAGVYGLGGAIGLSVFKAFLSGVVIWCVVTISRPRTPTWWTAIAAVVGLVALIPFLTATSELITLLGCGLLLRLFIGWRYQEKKIFNWKIAVLFLLWANSDPRMFLGLLLLLLLAVGEMLRRKPSESAPIIPSGVLWQTVGVAFVASLLNPFGWNVWLSAMEVYSVSDPLMREYYAGTSFESQITNFPIWYETYWQSLTIPFVAGLTVGGLILAVLFLNYDKLVPGELFSALVFAGLAAVTLRELGPAVIVGVVFVSLNGQDWYRSSFSQEYRVNQWEMMFSRGGRALTVLSFMAVAWLGMTGRLYEGSDRTIGFGFENQLENAVAGLTEDLKDDFDNKPFNFTLKQGDILIWADQRVFIDSRLALFRGTETDVAASEPSQLDLIAVHDQTRAAMRRSSTQEEALKNRETWRAAFAKFEITHAQPRIVGRSPDYLTYTDLMLNPEFNLTKLTPTVAVFYRTNLGDETLQAYVDQDKYREFLLANRINFLDEAFGEKTAVSESLERGVFPQPESAYVSYLTAGREKIPTPLVLSQHYLQHIQQSVAGAYQIDFRVQLAFAYLAIRNANLALAENPDSSLGFLTLGKTYYDLGLLEARFCEANGIPYDINFRFLQAHMAYHQALIGDPQNLIALMDLHEIALARQRPEPALKLIDRILNIEGDVFNDEQRSQLENTRDQLQARVDALYEQGQKQIDLGVDPLQVAAALGTRGCPYRALEMFELSEADIPPNSQPKFFQGIFELETGQVEAAYNTLLTLEPMFAQMGILDGYRYACWAALGHADYKNALELNETETMSRQQQGVQQALFNTIPMTTDIEIYSSTRMQGWQQFEFAVQSDVVRNLWEQSTYMLEQGKNEDAEMLLTRALEISPDSTYRPLIQAYLSCVGEELQYPISPSDNIPIDGDIVPQETAGTEDTPTEE